MNTKKIVLSFLVLSSVFCSGCISFVADDVRREQIDSYTNRLDVLAREYLSNPLSLGDAIAIAMTNNFEVRKSDLDLELARLGKSIAFSAFIPSVSLKAGYNSYQKDPQIASRSFATSEIDAAMPVLMPSTWFLYDAAKHGYAAGKISSNYTRQGIALQTTDNYCNVLVQEDLVKAYEVQLKAAREKESRVKGLADEGLVAEWEGKQASYNALAREVQYNHAKRELKVLRAKFLSDLGVPPGYDFSLSGDTSAAAGVTDVNADLNDLVMKALESHPLLSIADRQVVIKQTEVRKAFCDFLPTVSAYGSRTWSGNKVMTVSPNIVGGFSAAWTVFNGFANVNKYKAATVESEKAELERENTFLSVIVNVTSAEAAWRDSIENRKVRQEAYDVAKSKYEDYEAKSREGLIPVGDALDAQSAMDIAQVELLQSSYQEITARAALEFAMGSIAY